jgi:hypothetical protein
MNSLDHAAPATRRDAPVRASDCADPAGESPILAAFRARGETARQWALARGHRPATVYRVINVWGRRTDRAPLGGLSRVILAELREDLGPAVVPDVELERAA